MSTLSREYNDRCVVKQGGKKDLKKKILCLSQIIKKHLLINMLNVKIKLFFLTCIVFMQVSCNKQEIDIPPEFRERYYKTPREFRIPEKYVNKPHEYITTTGYGKDWNITDFWLPRTGPAGIRKYFDLNSGECGKYLKMLSSEKVYRMMNFLNARNDVPIKYTKLQCVAYHGVDESCRTTVREATKDVLESAELLDPVNGKAYAMVFLMQKISECDIRKETGIQRIFSLVDKK